MSLWKDRWLKQYMWANDHQCMVLRSGVLSARLARPGSQLSKNFDGREWQRVVEHFQWQTETWY